MAIELDIVIRSKRVQWGGASGEADIVWLGQDLSAATWAMDVRALPGDTATALVALATAAAGAQGISATYDAGYLHPATGATVGATTIRPQINETTMEGLATATPGDGPFDAHYDIHMTLSGVKRLFAFGRFVYHPGVTL